MVPRNELEAVRASTYSRGPLSQPYLKPHIRKNNGPQECGIRQSPRLCKKGKKIRNRGEVRNRDHGQLSRRARGSPQEKMEQTVGHYVGAPLLSKKEKYQKSRSRAATVDSYNYAPSAPQKKDEAIKDPDFSNQTNNNRICTARL